MYIELIRKLVEQGIEFHAEREGQTEEQILKRVRKHIDRTSSEFWKSEPNINYENPLCRLGYLYRHVPANATLFRHVLSESDTVSDEIHNADQSAVDIFALGGGPGTELLGVAKYLLQRTKKGIPRKIAFTVIDNIAPWAESWQQLSDDVESLFCTALRCADVQPPIIAPSFLTLDVFEASSYDNLAYQLGKADIVVCNYLFSENNTV